LEFRTKKIAAKQDSGERVRKTSFPVRKKARCALI
jgi:hypothetical protein